MKVQGPNGRAFFERSARDAERQADTRIEKAERRIREAEQASSQAIDRIKDNYEQQSAVQNARYEAALDSEREQGNEAIRKLQTDQQNELSRVRREGERSLSSLNEYYKTEQANNEHRGKIELKEALARQELSRSSQERYAEEQTLMANAEQTQRLHDLLRKQDDNYAAITNKSTKEFERYKENAEAGVKKAEEKFQNDFQLARENYDKILDRINRNTTEDIHRLQESTARKLDAYNDRLHDPFYQLVVTDAKLSENSDSYVLTATIPPHEQEQISINIRGNQLVLSGNRRSKEKIEDAPGRELSTSSFQTFSETFPLDMPVDSRALSRRFDGDQLTVTIPKRLNYKPAPMHEIKKAEPIRAERPKFPDNLTAADIGTKPERDEPLTLS